VRLLTFYTFLEDRMFDEAAIYERHRFKSLMLENIAAPYFVRGQQQPVIYWVMLALAEKMKEKYPSLQLGIQILACSDDWAMEIACRCGLDFLRSESALFEGLRPEGRTPNLGNLARLYMTRNMLMAALTKDRAGPKVYVDVEKKHTVFMAGLSSLDAWLENILFQKLEGVIVTGRATGCPVKETDLHQAREAIEKVKEQSCAAVGSAWTPLLIVGSGVSTRNAAMCKRYADAVIVGSSLKRQGYWECALDEERVQLFAETWHGA
jgi:predicted TIM-barrel enzyme